MKKGWKILIWSVITIIILMVALNEFNWYIGYIGYNQHKYRRFSQTVEESKQRNVFITDINFQVDSIKVDNVFIERAYKWGWRYEDVTVLLEETDTFNAQSEFPYQIIILFDEVQNKNIIAVNIEELPYKTNSNKTIYVNDYRNRVLIKNTDFKDTLYYNVFIRDSVYNLKGTDVLKVWR
jgi:hypothetical protein